MLRTKRLLVLAPAAAAAAVLAFGTSANAAAGTAGEGFTATNFGGTSVPLDSGKTTCTQIQDSMGNTVTLRSAKANVSTYTGTIRLFQDSSCLVQVVALTNPQQNTGEIIPGVPNLLGALGANYYTS